MQNRQLILLMLLVINLASCRIVAIPKTIIKQAEVNYQCYTILLELQNTGSVMTQAMGIIQRIAVPVSVKLTERSKYFSNVDELEVIIKPVSDKMLDALKKELDMVGGILQITIVRPQ